MPTHNNPLLLTHRIVPLLVLAAASLGLYWPALNHQFLINWDDLQYVLENPAIRGLTIANIKDAFSGSYLGNYAPIHIISYMIDFQVWGFSASGFISTNILLHCTNGILFYTLLRRKTDHARVWPLFAALLFLLHPIQVESVVWVSQRKNLLAMLFMLVSLHAWLRYQEQTPAHRLPLYLLSLAAFVLALLTKSVTVVLPLILIIYDICFLQKRTIRNLLPDKLPLLAAAAACAVAAIASHSSSTLGGITSYHGGSPYSTVLTMLTVLASYLRLIAWPIGLSAYYDVPVKTGVDGAVAGAALLALLLIAAGVMLYRRNRHLFFWYAAFFIFLLPVSQIVPIVTLMNDRYLYFPMIGAAPLLCSLALGDASWDNMLSAPRRWLPATACAILLTACTLTSAGRIPVWQDSYTLWSDTVTKAPGVPFVHDALGESLLLRGRLDEATGQFMTSLKLQPSPTAPGLTLPQRNALATTYNNLGSTCGMRGDTGAAVNYFSDAVRLDPSFDKAHFNLGNALASSGRLKEALQSFQRAAQLNPAREDYRANLELTRRLLAQPSSTAPPMKDRP